ncbi:MAG: hypothetical protein R6V40_04055 [Candidatus Moraniibacteriota bacterium]
MASLFGRVISEKDPGQDLIGLCGIFYGARKCQLKERYYREDVAKKAKGGKKKREIICDRCKRGMITKRSNK